eukprot:scaffold2032_cov122-Cylindrotheca_fusiformis.AAC.5
MDDIDPGYFVYTSEMKAADIPGLLTHLRIDSSVKEIPADAFFSKKGLVHVQLPETLTRIGASAFCDCSKLTCVQIISDDPFETSSNNPASLEDGMIVFPERSMLQIDAEAFYACYSLRKVIVCSVSTNLGEAAFCDCFGLISVELPEGLQVITALLFGYCESLTTVNIPSSVIKIGKGAFQRCSSLTLVDLPHGLLEIGKCAFEGCCSIEALHIPPTVSTIGEMAFGHCGELKHIKLPSKLERIERNLCNGCERLEYVDMPVALTRIDGHAFHKCSSLSHIRIPPSVESIAIDAFIGCSSMISIEIPEQIVSDIDLSGCLSLVSVYGDMEYTPTFLQSSRLGSVVDDEAEPARSLKHRFDNAPLNKLCYYHSYHSSEDAMVQLRFLLDENPLAATTQVDEFGMSPLHTLLLSQTPNLDMLVALMNGGNRDHVFLRRDAFGSTPMDYLCLNRMPNASQVIRRVLQTRFDEVLGLDNRPWKKSDVLEAIDEASGADWSSRRREIIAICLKLAKYERKEVSSVMELYLWKVKIDEVDSTKEQIVDRQSCRINSGASIVIPYVLSFLDKFDLEDFFASSP